MDRDKASLKLLGHCLTELRECPRPIGVPVTLLSDADVDLWEEDAYFVGIASRILRGEKICTDTMSLPDPSIDLRIDAALRHSPDSQSLVDLQAYRQKLLVLVRVLRKSPCI